MFVRAKKEPSGVASVIGSGVVIEGDVRFSGVLRVDGTVRGKISALPGHTGTLIVGAGGRIDGEVAATDVVVHGTLDGVTMRCGNLALASTARVTGQLHYDSIDVTAGAIVEAQLVNRATSDQAELATSEPALALSRP
jgi:cytoskeletal protein CcmA (bactofilin family)